MNYADRMLTFPWHMRIFHCRMKPWNMPFVKSVVKLMLLILYVTVMAVQGNGHTVISGQLVSGVFKETRVPSFTLCQSLCWYSTPCRAYTWATGTGLCQLSRDTRNTSPASFSVSRHHVYSDTTAPLGMKRAHPCASQPCSVDEVCVPVAAASGHLCLEGDCQKGCKPGYPPNVSQQIGRYQTQWGVEQLVTGDASVIFGKRGAVHELDLNSHTAFAPHSTTTSTTESFITRTTGEATSSTTTVTSRTVIGSSKKTTTSITLSQPLTTDTAPTTTTTPAPSTTTTKTTVATTTPTSTTTVTTPTTAGVTSTTKTVAVATTETSTTTVVATTTTTTPNTPTTTSTVTTTNKETTTATTLATQTQATTTTTTTVATTTPTSTPTVTTPTKAWVTSTTITPAVTTTETSTTTVSATATTETTTTPSTTSTVATTTTETTTVTTTSTTTTTPTTANKNSCVENCEGLNDKYPHCSACNMYVVCAVTGKVEMTCAGSLEWNNDIKTCVFPPSPTCA